MSEPHEICYGGKRIEFQLRHSQRKTLAITVQPDLGVVVVAPRKAALDTVLAKVRKRAGWIRRQQRFFSEFLPQTPPRRYVSGETHRYLGRQYRLKVVESEATEVKMRGRFIWVHTPRKRDTARVRKLVEGWYLAHAKARLARNFEESVARMGTRLAIPNQRHRQTTNSHDDNNRGPADGWPERLNQRNAACEQEANNPILDPSLPPSFFLPSLS